MTEPRLLPTWADDLRRRYLRGEASMFVLHGNVFDAVVHESKMRTLTEFLTEVLFRDSRQTVAVYNLATGVRFARREAGLAGTDEALVATEKPRALAALERLLVGASKVAVVLEYAEAIAPSGDPAFQADSDRGAIITLQRWSFLPEIDRGDNLVRRLSLIQQRRRSGAV